MNQSELLVSEVMSLFDDEKASACFYNVLLAMVLGARRCWRSAGAKYQPQSLNDGVWLRGAVAVTPSCAVLRARCDCVSFAARLAYAADEQRSNVPTDSGRRLDIAVVKLKRKHTDGRENRRFDDEIEFWRKFKDVLNECPNIVAPLAFLFDGRDALVFEDGGVSLENMCFCTRRKDTAAMVLRDVSKAFQFMHRVKVAHVDVQVGRWPVFVCEAQ